MLALIYRTIKDSRFTLLIYVVAAILMVWMFVSLFPSFSESAADFTQLLESYPPALIDAFGINDSMFTNLGSFVGVENFSFMWPIISIAMVTSLASWAIAGQIEKNTMSVLLSYPISRTQNFLAKYLSGLLVIVLFCLTSIYSIVFFAKMYDISYEIANYNKLFVTCLLFLWAIYAIGLFFSAVFSDRGKVIFATAGLVIAMYAVDLISTLKDNLDKLKYGSFFHYFDYSLILENNQWPDNMFWVFGGTIIVFTALALLVFNKRDISV